ncbi:MAG: DUF2267 domain-containing protein [Leptolyngbyaceae cyanobacterium SM1_4_3]|nr:DUF2267 domain-containing protein [Leptolyngbyaceae cyanobacterium SM1_4_3]NJN91024.1 DUF2267 domain-containing protein [Leptolyngbyaceae cyanobacterium SL_5_14]NJO66897.1 DUF2267 domain-containing protein [Leptolyngbyaceae cyanobacterium RM1_405_57]
MNSSSSDLSKVPDSTPEAAPVAATSFLKKVMVRGELEDLYDARDIAEVVFRTMRDMMPTEVSDRVAAELQGEAIATKDKALQNDVADLWKDTNPIVRFLSRLRPPLVIEPETFLFRIRQEAGLSNGVEAEVVIAAVFSAVKAELSQERIDEITGFLPGEIKQMWRQA